MPEIISGRYELEGCVGEGGMAKVYRARDLQTDRRVALKVLKSEYQSDADFIRRFKNEAAATMKMSHPNIVKTFGVGYDEKADVHYIVMEYIKGTTLMDIIRKEKRLEPRKAIVYALKILAALNYAHKDDFVHRDIKPHNILVSDENSKDVTVKVADFGIARQTGNMTQTNANAVFGSVHYVSPEQAQGQHVDSRSDLYSLGVVLYEMLTGQLPFTADEPLAVALMHVQRKPANMTDINSAITPGLNKVVMKALEKDPNNRYQDAKQMAKALKKALKNPNGVHRRLRLNHILVALAIMTVLAIVSLGVVRIYDILYGVNVPNVTNYTRSMAEQVLQGYELTVNIVEVYSDMVNDGQVVRQSPEPGTRSKRNSVVDVYVSCGEEPVYLPNTVGMTLTEARSTLSMYGFTMCQEEYVVDSTRPLDVIVEQQPNTGTTQKDSIITLKVNSQLINTPQLYGMTTLGAEAELTKLGLKLGEITMGYAMDDAPDTVIAQYPSANTLLVKGSKVNITVSLPNPKVYYGKYSVYAPLKMNVRVMLETPSGITKKVFNGLMSADSHQELDMTSDEPGTHRVYVYFDDVLNVTESVEFK